MVDVIRVHTLSPVELWSLAIKHGVPPLDLAKYLAWGVGSTDADYIREVSELALVHDRGSASTPPEVAKHIAIGGSFFLITIKRVADFEVGGTTCAVCIDAVLHHFLLIQLYAIARAHGLRPVVHEGAYKGVKYVIVAASEAGLPEAVKEMETMIERVCRRAGRTCR